MLRWKRVEISAGALLLGAALYYLDEQGVLLMAFCACALHELGHWLVIRALGGRVTALRITCVGAEMRLSARCPLGCWQQIAAALAVGDTVRVHLKVKEGNRERIQIFEGTVIAKKHGGIEETITVRRISYGVGVEKVFPIHAPTIEKIETVRKGKVRRAKLYYLRDRVGKSAKVKERI